MLTLVTWIQRTQAGLRPSPHEGWPSDLWPSAIKILTLPALLAAGSYVQPFGPNESPRTSWTIFFPQHFLPQCLGLYFFHSTKTGKCFRLPDCNFSGPGFWVLTKGGIRQPVLVCHIQIPSKCWGWSNLLIWFLN